MSPHHFLYLHGFNSSGESQKAQQVAAFLQAHYPEINFSHPQLPSLPEDAKAFITSWLGQHSKAQVSLIGSSLGGFYATYFSQRNQLKAILINPAVAAHQLLTNYLGPQQNPYTLEKYQLTERHMHSLKSMHVDTIAEPKNLLLLLQMQDEVLNAKQVSHYYQKCPAIIEPKGNHAFQGLARFLPYAVSWLLNSEGD